MNNISEKCLTSFINAIVNNKRSEKDNSKHHELKKMFVFNANRILPKISESDLKIRA